MEKGITTTGGALFDELQIMRPYVSSAFLTKLERACMRVSFWCLIGSVAGFVMVLCVAAVRYLTGPLAPWLQTTGLTLAALDVLAVYGMLIAEAVSTFLQVASNKVRNHHDRGNFAHDRCLASRIRAYPTHEISEADAWLEQQGAGMERRVSALFGRELAVITVVTTLLTGKANEVWSTVVGFLAPTFHTSPNLVTGALLVGLFLLVVGAFRVKARVARLAYLRYLIRLSAIAETPPETGTAPMSSDQATATSASVTNIADHRAP